MSAERFRTLVKADLRRFFAADANPSGIRLWSRLVHPRYGPVLLIRIAAFTHDCGWLKPVARLCSMANVVVFGLEATPFCAIGGGLMIPHSVGTVIGAAEIGRNVTIFQGVTLGAKYADLDFSREARPILEDDVVIGAGAKVLGNIRIGRGSVVAANSLVVASVPPGCLAIGVPAVVSART